MSLNLSGIVEVSARRFPNELALLDGERRISYRQLRESVRRTANALRGLGIRPGDRVGLMVRNAPEFTIPYFGILHAGAVVVPLNTLFVPAEVKYHLNDSETVLVVAGPDLADTAERGMRASESCRQLVVTGADPLGGLALEDLTVAASAESDPAATMPDDTAVILYTSGTTGRPKGAELTHFNLWSNAQWSSERSQSVVPDRMVCFGPGTLALATLPLFHSFGQTCVQNSMLFNGGALTYLSRWDPDEALRLLDELGVTHFSGVPTMYFGLLHAKAAGRKLSRLRFCNSGGAPMPVEVMAEFEAKYPAQVMEGYGLSETSPVATFHTPEFPRRPGAVGKAIDGCEIAIFDDADRPIPPGQVGEVVIRGHNIMKGYWRQPEATAEALRSGWFHSGDLGRVDEEGYLYIVDRKKDMVLRGGFNVYPRELEEILYAHPAIREAAVLGVPHPEHGEEVVAVVALREGTTLTEPELIAYCKERMAAYKYPRQVHFRDALPKGATGKILKRELRDQLLGKPSP